MSDLIPTIHEKSKDKHLLDLQPLLMLLGAAVVAFSIQLAHNYVGHDDHAESTPKTYIHIDADGVPHGEEGHDHSTMQDAPADDADHADMGH